MPSQIRARRLILLLVIPTAIVLTLFSLRSSSRSGSLPETIDEKLPTRLTGEPTGYDPKDKPKPLFKPPLGKPPPIEGNFRLASKAKSASDLPSIPTWNKPPRSHVKHSTPLFIGFTRNWRLLQQTVVSYIVAGWPPADIYVIENTGVMNSNRDGLLSLQNPFYLDHHRLTKILGVNVISTPTLFTFAQLQNFYIWTALEKGWEHYWWAHMDTVVVSDEEFEGQPYKSLYMRAVDALEETLEPSWGPLATLWFAYDRLALVRTKAFVEVGGWDTMIPFYMTDCDMHERLWMREFRIENAQAGKVWDVAGTLDDLGMLYQRGDGGKKERRGLEGGMEGKVLDKRKEAEVQRNSPAYKDLLVKLDELQTAKAENKAGRNTWQASQKGGQGDPFYRDSDGFEKGLWMWMDFGRSVFTEKWGRGQCDIRDAGLKDGDEWRVIADWEKEEVQRKYWKDKGREAKEREKEAKEKGKGER
ncbi:MAG: hypothetical protein Q9164_001319 [Protoblastenia rupestris]